MNDFIKDNFWTLALIHAVLMILWFLGISAYKDQMTDSPLFWLFDLSNLVILKMNKISNTVAE